MTRSPELVAGPLGRMFAGHEARAAADAGAALGRTWQREVDGAVRHWNREVAPQWQATIEQQVQAAVAGGNVDGLLRLGVPSSATSAALLTSMQTMAAAGVAAVVREAKSAGLVLEPPPPLAAVTLADWARVSAEVLASGYAASAGREALRLLRPGVAAAAVVDGVKKFLGRLTDRGPRDVLGGALTRAQNVGKLAAYAQKPPNWSLELVADETLDSNTCQPCRKIDGTVLPSAEAAALAYGGAGYLHCEGGQRCRGTCRGVWVRTDGADDAHRALIGVLANLRSPVPYSGQMNPPGRDAR